MLTTRPSSRRLQSPCDSICERAIVVAIAALACASTAASGADPASAYPNRPVRIISGSPGSTADITARFIGQKLFERFRQPMVIDNRASAGGIVGEEVVYTTPEEFDRFQRAEIAKWTRVIREAKIQAN